MRTRYPQAILVSCEIPWDDRGRLIEAVLREEIRTVLRAGFRHLYTFGTAGEGYAVTLAQFQEIVRVFHDATRQKGVFPMIGVIAMSTPQVIERVGFAYNLGIRAFQICLPPWGALGNDEYLTFFKDVCGSFPGAKFIHYNLPRTKRLLLGPDYRKLADAVPNLAGTKNCRTDLTDIYSIATHSPELQHFYGEHGFANACLLGECSLLASFAALFPTKTKKYLQYGVTGQYDKLFRLQADYFRAMDAFLAPTGGEARIDGAYDKMIVRAAGVDMPLRLLSPYQGFSEKVFRACVANLRRKCPGWIG
jgi:dihydrodipicolinate synthase/N-acetylneuraminate lyase